MTAIGQMYSFEDFNAILFKRLGDPLPAEIKQLLAYVESQLDITPDQPVTQHPVTNRRVTGGGHGAKDRYRSRQAPVKREDEWEAVRAFKATKIEMKVGIEKIVNDIRIALNKMSTSNYEKQKDAVLALVEGVATDDSESTEVVDDIQRISKAVFDIASTNKFYSEIYAKLYSELAQRYLVFRDLIAEFVSNFSKNAGALQYIDPDVDYDGFCVYTKSCDVRKATTTFIVNCLKLGLIDTENVIQIVNENLAFVDKWMREEGKTKEVEEIVENLFIMTSLAKNELKMASEWASVVEQVRGLAKTKGNTWKSWSNRAAFKMMDLVELV